MPGPLEVDYRDIERLSADRLTCLLSKLLRCEATKNSIPQSSIEVGMNISAPDGGIDARIEWKDIPIKTDFLPCQSCVFQIKSGRVQPNDIKLELTNKDTIKPLIDRAFQSESAYILFVGQERNVMNADKLKNAIRNVLKSNGKSYADSASIHIYDAEKIRNWVNSFPSVTMDVCNWSGKPVPTGLMSLDSWQQFSDHAETNFVVDDQRRQIYTYCVAQK